MGQLEEIGRATFNPTQFADIIYIIDKRLNDHGKNWRHVYKTLLVLEYCVCCGADSMITFGKERLHEIKTLKEFISVDDHGHDNGACVREKCKDIVGLLSDDILLSEARRTKRPPLERRPSSTGPLTISAGQPISKNGASGKPVASSLRNRSAQSRRSFEDLQDVDEDAALRMALEESKAEYESVKIASQSKYCFAHTDAHVLALIRDSAFDSLMEHVSRSSSGKSSVANLKPDAKPKGPFTAEQLLDLDDTAFAEALDSSYTSSHRNSLDIFANMPRPSSTGMPGSSLANPIQRRGYGYSTQYQVDPYAAVGNSYPPNTYANPFEQANPEGHQQFGHPVDTSNPFNVEISETSNQPHDGQQSDPASDIVHPIAIPGVRYKELSMGAKPVMPGNLAPQFGHKPAQSNNEPQIVVDAPGVDKNEPSGSGRDPFADLI